MSFKSSSTIQHSALFIKGYLGFLRKKGNPEPLNPEPVNAYEIKEPLWFVILN
jgi:hypothetical protein